jgi:hypothetical protein
MHFYQPAGKTIREAKEESDSVSPAALITIRSALQVPLWTAVDVGTLT